MSERVRSQQKVQMIILWDSFKQLSLEVKLVYVQELIFSVDKRTQELERYQAERSLLRSAKVFNIKWVNKTQSTDTTFLKLN